MSHQNKLTKVQSYLQEAQILIEIDISKLGSTQKLDYVYILQNYVKKLNEYTDVLADARLYYEYTFDPVNNKKIDELDEKYNIIQNTIKKIENILITMGHNTWT